MQEWMTRTISSFFPSARALAAAKAASAELIVLMGGGDQSDQSAEIKMHDDWQPRPEAGMRAKGSACRA